MDNQPYTIPSPNDWGSDDYSYADREFTDEDDLPEKNGASREKSPERKRREAEFLALYNEYMHPTKKLSAFRTQCQQDDLYTLLKDAPQSYFSDMTHYYTQEATEVITAQVLQHIAKAIDVEPKAIHYADFFEKKEDAIGL
jgi:hypothetical protein